MSRAFTRDGQENEAADVLPDRPVSPHRNLVTRRGLALTDAALAESREAFAAAEREGDRAGMARASRDIRYWTARRASAELSEPAAADENVRFGSLVELAYDDGRTLCWRIVGEDEADGSTGRISHVAPLAKALFGRGEGDRLTVGKSEVEIRRVVQSGEAAG